MGLSTIIVALKPTPSQALAGPEIVMITSSPAGSNCTPTVVPISDVTEPAIFVDAPPPQVLLCSLVLKYASNEPSECAIAKQPRGFVMSATVLLLARRPNFKETDAVKHASAELTSSLTSHCPAVIAT